LFPVRDRALGDRPGAFVLPRPERSTRMREEHLEAAFGLAVEEESRAGHRRILAQRRQTRSGPCNAYRLLSSRRASRPTQRADSLVRRASLRAVASAATRSSGLRFPVARRAML